MSKSEKIEVVLKRVAIMAPDKQDGVLTNAETLKPYKRHIEKFCKWLGEKGIYRMHQILESGRTARDYVQEFADTQVKRGLKATSVHTYLAPICKGFGICMSEIRKPPRLSEDIVKNTKQHQNKAGAAQELAPENQRIIHFAECVGIRPVAMSKLTIDNLVQDNNGDFIIDIRDKGGKHSIQLIRTEEVDYVRNVLTHDAAGNLLAPGEKPFCRADLKQIAFSKYRILRAQHLMDEFEARFNSWRAMPRKTAEQRIARSKAREAAEREKALWVDKIVEKYAAAHPKASAANIAAYRTELERPSRIVLRRGNKERAKLLYRPLDYDRVAVRIVSVYALSHWHDESTLRNYLTK